jgi:catechol 2,3-dioxygenase-like lactoylglutathione lyase family enzyme
MPAVDMERAKRFYEEKLGLRAVEMGEGGVMFECGQGTQLALYLRETPTKADHTAAGFVVDNIEEVVRGLREKGVVFEQYDMPGIKTDEQGIAVMEGSKGAWFKDTEGNILSVFQFE